MSISSSTMPLVFLSIVPWKEQKKAVFHSAVKPKGGLFTANLYNPLWKVASRDLSKVIFHSSSPGPRDRATWSSHVVLVGRVVNPTELSAWSVKVRLKPSRGEAVMFLMHIAVQWSLLGRCHLRMGRNRKTPIFLSFGDTYGKLVLFFTICNSKRY